MLFDRLITDAFWCAVLILACSLSLMLGIFCLHFGKAFNRRQATLALSKWNAILAQTLAGQNCDVRAMKKQGSLELLQAWCNAVENVLRSSQPVDHLRRLEFLAKHAALDRIAMDLLEYGDGSERVVAAKTLGCLGEHSARVPLEILCSSEDGDLSFAAASALLRIDASFVYLFVKCLRDRGDWVATRVEQVLRENASIAGPAFVTQIRDADDLGIGRLLVFAALLDRYTVRSVAIYVLERPQTDMENLAAALRALRPFVEPGDLQLLSALVDDPTIGVRVQAVNALGQLNDPQVEVLLAGRLNDLDSWVRRRAGEALARHNGEVMTSGASGHAS